MHTLSFCIKFFIKIVSKCCDPLLSVVTILLIFSLGWNQDFAVSTRLVWWGHLAVILTPLWWIFICPWVARDGYSGDVSLSVHLMLLYSGNLCLCLCLFLCLCFLCLCMCVCLCLCSGGKGGTFVFGLIGDHRLMLRHAGLLSGTSRVGLFWCQGVSRQ